MSRVLDRTTKLCSSRKTRSIRLKRLQHVDILRFDDHWAVVDRLVEDWERAARSRLHPTAVED